MPGIAGRMVHVKFGIERFQIIGVHCTVKHQPVVLRIEHPEFLNQGIISDEFLADIHLRFQLPDPAVL